jgi:cation:H+ antiporter
MDVLLLVAGLVLVVLGAEALVRGASRLASRFGIPPLIVGLTIVAYGTSAPELAVSTASGLRGATGIALGNVVGSNIFNVLFILGISAIIAPLGVSRQLVRMDVPLMIGLSCVVFAMAADGRIGRIEGLALALGALVYTAVLVRVGSRSRRGAAGPTSRDVAPRPGGSRLADLARIAVGLALLVLGARWLLHGAVAIARDLGVSELVIGLTLVAAGTSLPEVATSIVASLRGERDIAVGNVVGSNIFNLLAVLGVAGLVTPGGIDVAPSALRFDLPVMVAAAVACLPIFFTGYEIARWEGALLAFYYAAYTGFLGLSAAGAPAARTLGAAMVVFVVPITFVTLGVLALRAARRRPAGGA